MSQLFMHTPQITMLPLEKPITTRALAFSPCGSMIAGVMFGYKSYHFTVISTEFRLESIL